MNLREPFLKPHLPIKLAAMVVFIVLPFVGFLFGLKYQKMKMESDNPQPTSITPHSTPTVSVDETTNWKTYVNDESGFSIKYPPFVDIQEGNVAESEFQIIDFNFSYDPYQGATIHVEENSSDLSTSEYVLNVYNSLTLENNDGDEVKLDSEVVQVSGIDSLKVSNLPNGREFTIFVPHNQKMYKISLNKNPSKFTENYFKLMLSSFNILKDGEPSNTSSWQTYVNEEYGFSFKYPSSLFLRKNGTGGDLITLSSYGSLEELPPVGGDLFSILVNIETSLSEDEDLAEWARERSVVPLSDGSIGSHIQGSIEEYPMSSGTLSAVSFTSVVESEIKHVYVRKDNTVVMFTLHGGSGTGSSYEESELGKETLDRILSTFSFSN